MMVKHQDLLYFPGNGGALKPIAFPPGPMT